MDRAHTNDNRQTRGQDAGDQTPAPLRGKGAKDGRPDPAGDEKRPARDQAVPIDDVTSANDE